MATAKIQFTQTLVDGFKYSIANIVSILLTVLLYIVTVWIPYLNVGTTIGMYKAIIKIGRGEALNPTDIFAKENFDNLGDFFLLIGIKGLGQGAAAAFVLFPAVVVSIAWNFAMYFFVDRGVSPTKALKMSYKATNGEKWTLFFVYLVLVLVTGIVCGLLGMIPKVGGVLSALAGIFCAVVSVSVEGVLFKHFSDRADELFPETVKSTPEAPESTAAPQA